MHNGINQLTYFQIVLGYMYDCRGVRPVRMRNLDINIGTPSYNSKVIKEGVELATVIHKYDWLLKQALKVKR
jgi:hypothetical protein